MDQPQVVEVFVSGEAPWFVACWRGVGDPVGRTAVAPGFKAGAFFDVAVRIGDHIEGANVVVKQHAGFGGGVAVGDVNRHGLAVGLDQVTVRLMTTNVALTPNISCSTPPR